MKEFLIALGALATIALMEGLYYTVRYFRETRRDELRRRLQALGTGAEPLNLRLLRPGKLSGLPGLDALLRGIPIAERLEELLEQAQVDLTVARLLTLSMVGSIVGFGGGVFLGNPFIAILLGGIGAALPIVIVRGIRERRSLKLSEQLPDALDMMARSLRAGHALTAAFKLVASEMPAPVSLEFGHAFEQQNLGVSFDRAILQMTKRSPNNRDLKIFAVSVIIQKDTGGNLVELMEKIAETIRARYRFYGKLRSLTAEGRVSALIIGFLPILAGFAAAFLNPMYMRSLVVDPNGRMFLGYAAISWFLGIVLLRRMSRVEY